MHISFIQNWFEELKTKVPGGVGEGDGLWGPLMLELARWPMQKPHALHGRVC